MARWPIKWPRVPCPGFSRSGVAIESRSKKILSHIRLILPVSTFFLLWRIDFRRVRSIVASIYQNQMNTSTHLHRSHSTRPTPTLFVLAFCLFVLEPMHAQQQDFSKVEI